MLNCRQVAEHVSAMMDGELSLRERLSVRMHLLMCVHCRRFQRHLHSMVSALRSREPSTGPVDSVFVERLVNRLEDLTKQKDGPRGP